MSVKTILVTMAALGAAPVLAQPVPTPAPTPAPGAPAPAEPADPKVLAKAKYEKGLNHYNLGEFDAAIVEFKAAYALTSAPGLLFNIAQSYRLKKDYVPASLFYRNYLRLKPDAPNKADVEARIVEMDKSIEDQKGITLSPPQGMLQPDGETVKPAIDPKAVVVSAPAPKEPIVVQKSDDGAADRASGASLQTAGLATAGAGAALVLTGIVFGSMASSAEKDLNALSPNMGTWTVAEQDKYDAGKRNNAIAIITYVAGGAALATGGTLWFLGRLKVGHSTVAVVPTRTGPAFAMGWSF